MRNVAICILLLALATFAPAKAAQSRKLTGTFAHLERNLCEDAVYVQGTYDERLDLVYDDRKIARRVVFAGTVALSYTNARMHVAYRHNDGAGRTVDLASGQATGDGSSEVAFNADGYLVGSNGRFVIDAAGLPIFVAEYPPPDLCFRLGSKPIVLH